MELAHAKDTLPKTKQMFVYQSLREAIMRCELLPGSRLVTETIAKQLNVSLIPVREALQLLQAEGLVESSAHVGARVAPITRESITETFTVMEGLELVAARTVAQNMTPTAINSLLPVLHMMDGFEQNGQFEQWGDTNTHFHVAIASLTCMPMLCDMTARAFAQWDRIRRYFFRDVLALRIRTSQEEHYALLSAMRERDIPQITQLVQVHNQAALAAYLEHLSTSTTDHA